MFTVGSAVLVPRLRSTLGPLLERLAARLPPHPNAYTLASLAAALSAAYMGIRSYWLWALALFALSAMLDALDGAVARAHGRVSRSGALLDSVTDRATDACIVAGYAGLGVDTLVLFAMLAALQIYSYVRARAEGIVCRRLEGLGFFERGERTPLLLLPYLLAAIGLTSEAGLLVYILFFLTIVAVIDRVWRAHRLVESVDGF